MKTRLCAIAILAFLAFFAAPLGAQAVGDTPDTGGVIVNGTPAPGATLQVEFTEYSFSSSEPVSIAVTGQGAVVVAAQSIDTATVNKQASPDGAVSVTIDLPGDARGSYWINATGTVSGASSSAFVDLRAADEALPAVGGETGTAARAGAGVNAGVSANAEVLKDATSTVDYIPTRLLDWVALTVLALGAVIIATLRTTRRSRTNN